MLLLHFPLKRASLTPGGIFDLCASYLDFDGLGVFFGGDRPVLALVSDIEGKGKTCSLQREGVLEVLVMRNCKGEFLFSECPSFKIRLEPTKPTCKGIVFIPKWLVI